MHKPSTAFLVKLTNLKTLNLSLTLVSDISPITNLISLESLDIRGTRIDDLRPLDQSRNLVDLTIGAEQSSSLANLAHLNILKKLSIIAQQNIDLSAVGTLTSLENLFIWNSAPLDVDPLQNLAKLRNLSIIGFIGHPTIVAHIDVIGKLAELRQLSLGQLQVNDLTFVQNLRSLQELNISQLPVHSIEAVRKLNSLEKLSLVDIDVVDISPLLELPNFSELTILRVPARADLLMELERRGGRVNRRWLEHLFEEIYTATKNNLPRLALMGIRALLEQVMILKVRDNQSFRENLKKFQEAGYISVMQFDALDRILDAGHAVIHRGYTPKGNDLTWIMREGWRM